MNTFLILLGKLLLIISRFLNIGYGSTWPGHIALNFNKNFIKQIIKHNPQLKIILITGTNGKTTTGKLIRTILERSNYRVFQNESGANLLNGVASSLLLRSSILCKVNYDFAIFEMDENSLPLILMEIKNPVFLIILNLFRDQLDRYGEINTIVNKWREALKLLNKKTTVILNADDPQVASLRLHLEDVNVQFFGINDNKLATAKNQHAADSTYCANCGSKLDYSVVYYSHLGVWKCLNCKNSRPKLDYENSPNFPLVGIYNRYNTIAAVSLASLLNIEEKYIRSALENFQPAFGRQEILNRNNKKIQIFLSKNPTGFNESLKTIVSLKARNLLLVLNDRIPDGRDVSWIWDVDFEDFTDKFQNTLVSGDRAYDMALRLKYATQDYLTKRDLASQDNSKFKTYENLNDAVREALKITYKNETLYILPTYSAMLEVRKILTGKKIL